MLSRYDISRLQSIGIEQVAEALGITVSRHKAICPFHDDTRPSLTFNLSRNMYRCYVCDAKGDSIQLVMSSQGWTFYESCKWLASRFGIVLENDSNYMEFRQLKQQERKAPKPSPSSFTPTDTRYLENLMREPFLCEEARRFLFDERKISPQVVRQVGLSSISHPAPMSGNPNGSWFNAPSLLIPYRDIDGRLLSVQARYLGKVEREGEGKGSGEGNPSPSPLNLPRFQFPRGSRCGIFNLPILKTLSEGSELWITEGVTDCLAMMSSGRKAIAIPSATLLKPKDLEVLLSLSSSACPEPSLPRACRGEGLSLNMAPDNDAPGDKLFQELRKVLPNLQHHLLPAKYKDFGEYWKMLKC